ncbi:MAG: CGGC domain-containing protein [Sedimentisphaerales bacterium]|nr:CGGC domain-containing protein [Sedimentisphaerales bacterium]
MNLGSKDYIAIVQCDIVKRQCSGYACEKAFTDRSGGFAAYPRDKTYRVLNMSCGGCCGKAVHRKLRNLVRRLKKTEGMGKERIVVQLSSCITKDNYHSLPCPHIDYIKSLIGKVGLDVREDTCINEKSEKLRAEGVYASG